VADLDNKARYESYGASASFQFSSSGGNSANASQTGQGQNAESTQSSSTDASKSTTTYSRNYGVSLPQFGSTKGTTSSAIAEGSLEIRSGENVDVSRDTANANGSIGKIFDKGEVTRNAELSQTVGQVANMAIGEYAKSKTKNYELAQLDMQQALKASENASPEDAALLSQRIAHDQDILQQEQSTYDLWKDGGDAKIIAHTIAGAIQAQAGGGNILAGATSAGTTELSGTLVQDYLEKNYPDLSDTARKSIQQWISTMTGAGIGALTAQASGGNVASAAGTGAVVSQDAERYNRLLHPKEIVRLQKLAPEFARQLSSETGRTVTEAEALILLSNAAYADVDSDAQKFSAAYLASWSANPTGAMDYIAAKKFIEEDSQKAGTWVDDAGVTQRYFVAKPGKTDFYSSSMYSQYTDSQAYRNFSYSVLGINFPPTSKTDTVGWSIYNKNEAERLKQGATTFAEGLAITAIAAITERAVGVGVNYVQIRKTASYLNNGEAAAMMSSVDGELAEATLERQKLSADKAKSTSGDLNVCNGTACFIAGTMLHTSNGLKAIETLVNGELVWARDENTLEYGFRPIVATKATPNQALYEVVVGNSDGEQETLYTTAEHPFWVDGEGWRKASLLEAGMKLLGPQDELLEVVSQTATGGMDTVFNIQVHEFSTYHVGALGVWVHNHDCCSVGNMKEFLKSDGFGSDVSSGTQKTSKIYDGQSVYKATSSVGDYIKKNDQLYLDGLHKDHIELFDKNGNFKAVLNLDGTLNEAKTVAGEGRKLGK
jgi:filamentous hemagglutinin